MRKIGIFVLSALLCACANNIQVTEPMQSMPDIDSAYIAGGFVNSYRESFARMALELENLDSKKKMLIELQRLKKSKPLEIFRVPTGRYQIINLVEMGGIGDVGGKFAIEDSTLSTPFNVYPGAISYIGHYDGKSTNSISSAALIGSVAWVSTNSGYSFEMQNRSNDEVRSLLKDAYSAFWELEIRKVFEINGAQQTGDR